MDDGSQRIEQEATAAGSALAVLDSRLARTAVRMVALALDADPGPGEAWHPDDVEDLGDLLAHLAETALGAAQAALGSPAPLWERAAREARSQPASSSPFGAALGLTRAVDRCLLDAWRARSLPDAPVDPAAAAAPYRLLAALSLAALERHVPGRRAA